jgi:SlyX protein
MTAPQPIARIDALEAHSAHQDRALAELSDAVAAQWTRIDALTREVLRLREELRGMSQINAPEKPPPHY